MNWKRTLPKIHIYGGLLVSGFVLMMAFSAFVHQHHPKFMEHEGKRVQWEASFEKPRVDANWKFKPAVRDSLGLFGYTPWWEDYRDSSGVHHFMISRPGKKYWVTVPKEGNVFKIESVRTGILDVLNALHPLSAGMKNHGDGPGFILLWKYFALPLGIIFFVVICITVFYWFTRSIRKKYWWYLIAGAASIPITLYIMIWLVG